MATLTLKSKNQILSAMIAKLLTETGLNDINPGSVVLTLLQLAATEDFQQYVQMLNVIRNYNLDTTTGQDLDTRAFEYGLTRQQAISATGKVDILRPVGFVKVSTSLYPGFPAPLAGDTVLRVNDASNILYGTSGTLIIGRGTANEEEVTYSVAPVDNTNYWEFTVSAFSNDHTLDDTVILKQGVDEVIPAGTVIIVPGTSNSPEISFTVNQDTTLLAGEEEATDVEVTATTAGTIGNIPIQAIDGEEAFSSAPFSGARAINNSKFTTGKDLETDDELRDRIKNAIQSLSRGTATAVKNAIVGALDEETAKRVVSANLIEPSNLQDPVKIYIDDGTGFEPSFESQGFETILLNSTGGEERVQLDLFPLVKAQIETTAFEPYDMSAGSLTLTYSVGLATETITFVPQDFEFPNAATAEEIVALINDKATIIEARTSQVGKKVVIQAMDDTNEDIQVTSGTANAKLLFPTDKKSTLFLYVDDVLQSKDGVTAFVDSISESYNFSGLGAGPWPLTVVVDGKVANTATVNFVSGDFALPAAATAEEVAIAINARLPGAMATVIENGTKVRIASNTELSSSSKIQVTGGSANGVLGFSTSLVTGQDKDYTLNRELGQISFNTPLTANQQVTAGSQYTRAKFRTASAEFYTITAAQTLVVTIDGGSPQTITFPSSGTFSAQQVADLINAQLIGGTAYVREVGTDNYLEVSTNTYTDGAGTILISSSSSAVALDFPYNQTATNQRPHRAFRISTISGPYAFVEGDNLVVVIDDDPATKTFNIILDFDGSVTAAGSGTVFTNAVYNTIFLTNNILNGFYVVMKTGPNTTTGNISDVTIPVPGTTRFIFSTLPTGLANYAAGDHVSISGLTNLDNNGNFLITAVNTAGSGYIEVSNSNGVAETLASGTADLGQRRQVSAYNASTGQITVSSTFSSSPAVGNQFIILPSTLKNVVDYMNNEKITSISRRAYVEEASNNTQLQISSKSEGSDGYVQVTGGSANLKFGFSTTLIQGLQGYNYFTGLLKLVHKIVYGDDTDRVTYPGFGAAGVTFQILAPTVKEVAVNVNVTLKEGVSISSVEEDLKSEISAYVNGLGVGEDVIVSEIIDRVMGVDNIIDVEVIEPAANIAIQDNEISRTKSSLILIG
jgi:uncharacterized phage protein gp47/JayE